MSRDRLKPRYVMNYFHEGDQGFIEDSVLSEPSRGIYALVDGFGGQIAGVSAAKAVRSALKEFLETEAGDREATLPFVLRPYFSLAGNIIFNALIHANRQLHSSFSKKPINERGGASAVAGYIDGRTLALAGVGACAAYVVRNGVAERVLTPRSYERLVNPFHRPSGSEVSVPLAALGMHKDLEPEIVEFEVWPEDYLILASSNAPDVSAVEWSDDSNTNKDQLDSLKSNLRELGGYSNYSLSMLIF